jgi:hypothetical protein
MQTMDQQTVEVEVGQWVRTLSQRPEAIRHGQTVVVEGCVMHDNNPAEGQRREWWVHYLAPIVIDGEVHRGGWSLARDLTHIPHRDPRG